jgi:transposase
VLLPRLVAPTLLANCADDADEGALDRLRQAGKTAAIPPKRHRRKPQPFDRDLYAARHLVENFFCKLKQFRAIATRYDKHAAHFLPGVHAAAIHLWLFEDRPAPALGKNGGSGSSYLPAPIAAAVQALPPLAEAGPLTRRSRTGGVTARARKAAVENVVDVDGGITSWKEQGLPSIPVSTGTGTRRRHSCTWTGAASRPRAAMPTPPRAWPSNQALKIFNDGSRSVEVG